MPAITVGLDYFNEILNITALAAHPSQPVVFAGKSNGCVTVYDAMTGNEKAVLYSHVRDALITAIACSKNNILASVDVGARVKMWKLERSATGVWSAQSPILETSLERLVRQLVLSPEGDYLLASTYDSTTVWSTRTGELIGTSEFTPGERILCRWLSTPGPASEFLLLVDKKVERHSWSAFSEAHTRLSFPIFYDETFLSEKIKMHSAHFDAKSGHLLLDFRGYDENNATAKLLVFNYSASPDGIQPNDDYTVLGRNVKYFIGIASSRLVFIDRDSWLSSVNLVTYSGKEYVRHFYVPYEVVAGNTGVMAVLTAASDIAFAREGELAVVRNGMRFQNVIEIE
jgi:hypothetical protein